MPQASTSNRIDETLVQAAAQGDASRVRLLLQVADQRALAPSARRALMSAMGLGAGRTECVELLLGAMSAEDHRDAGYPALVLACAAGSINAGTVRALLRVASPDRPGRKAPTPLQLAARAGSTEATQALLDAGADPLRADSRGYTALMEAAERKQIETLRQLLPGSDAKALGDDGRNALMLACSANANNDKGRALACVELLAPVSDPSLEHNRRTAFEIALTCDLPGCADFLSLVSPRQKVAAAYQMLGEDGPWLLPRWAAKLEAEALSRAMGEGANAAKGTAQSSAALQNKSAARL